MYQIFETIAGPHGPTVYNVVNEEGAGVPTGSSITAAIEFILAHDQGEALLHRGDDDFKIEFWRMPF